MLCFIFLSVLALGGAFSPGDGEAKLQRGGCPMFWYTFNGRCYKYAAARMSWADAELHCVSQGANLVSIHSREEHNFVRRLIKNFDHSESIAWIGLSDSQKEGAWMWSDGSRVDYFLWYRGEPNNKGGNEDCVQTNFAQDKTWNDEACSGSYASVCVSRINC